MRQIIYFSILLFQVCCFLSCQQVEPVSEPKNINFQKDSAAKYSRDSLNRFLADSINKAGNKKSDKAIKDKDLIYDWSYEKACKWIHDIILKRERAKNKNFKFSSLSIADQRYSGMGQMAFVADYNDLLETLATKCANQARLTVCATPTNNDYILIYDDETTYDGDCTPIKEIKHKYHYENTEEKK